MPTLTIAEALAEFERLDRLIARKQALVAAFLLRDAALRDPLHGEGGSAAVLAREMNSLSALGERKLKLRRLIQAANEQAEITRGGASRSVADWLVWKREVVADRVRFLGQLATRIDQARREAARSRLKGANVVVHLDEKELREAIEALEEQQGGLAGQITLRNATASVEAPADDWATGLEDRIDVLLGRAAVAPILAEPWSSDAELCRLARDPLRKIEAIKRYRELTGTGLAEAKRAVEAFAG